MQSNLPLDDYKGKFLLSICSFEQIGFSITIPKLAKAEQDKDTSITDEIVATRTMNRFLGTLFLKHSNYSDFSKLKAYWIRATGTGIKRPTDTDIMYRLMVRELNHKSKSPNDRGGNGNNGRRNNGGSNCPVSQQSVVNQLSLVQSSNIQLTHNLIILDSASSCHAFCNPQLITNTCTCTDDNLNKMRIISNYGWWNFNTVCDYADIKAPVWFDEQFIVNVLPSISSFPNTTLCLIQQWRTCSLLPIPSVVKCNGLSHVVKAYMCLNRTVDQLKLCLVNAIPAVS